MTSICSTDACTYLSIPRRSGGEVGAAVAFLDEFSEATLPAMVCFARS